MGRRIRHFLFFQLPPWLWAAAIFLGSSIPVDYLPELIVFGPDKLAHVAVFFVFAVLVYRAIVTQRKFDILQRNPVFATVVIGFVYALFDEFHQFFVPGRTPDVLDIVADVTGIALGIFAVRYWYRKRGENSGRGTERA